MQTFIRCGAIAVFIITSTFALQVHAGEATKIELKDGSVISGEIISLGNGKYTVKSESLGTIKIPDSKIRSIRSAGSTGGGKKENKLNSAVDAISKKMAGNAELMKMILALQSDADFQAILNDPEIMKAINSGNYDALTANPKFLKLLNKSAVKDISKKAVK